VKILAIGRNYVEHINELNNERPEKPVVFLKPDTAVIKDNAPFYYPTFSSEIHHEIELVLKIGREGKNIDKKFAYKYYDQIGIGIDFTARDLQDEAKQKGLPWAIAKGFDGSAPVSMFIAKKEFSNLQNLNFGLKVEGIVRQRGNTKFMLFSFDYILAYVSTFFTLKKGDLIFTGTPKGVGPVKVGERLVGFIEDRELLHCEIK